MKSAFKIWSWKGEKEEKVLATNISSKPDARNKGPFVDEKGRPVFWVNWSKPTGPNNKSRKAHFSLYSHKSASPTIKNNVKRELEEKSKPSESPIHKLARLTLRDYLKEKITSNQRINWHFLDESLSDFPLSGNLLANAIDVETHYNYETSFGFSYEYDIAIIGPKVNKENLIVGAIELEKTHRFGIIKKLVSKCLGFPLVSINLEDYSSAQINKDWCSKILKETTTNSGDSLRRNYFYLHNTLYPVYLDIPENYRKDNKHQYVIFGKSEALNHIQENLRKFRNRLSLTKKEVLLSPEPLNPNEPSSIAMFENEGSIAGREWNSINKSKFLRVVLKVPQPKAGNLYLFHLIMSRLLNAHFECLIGYKYHKGIKNDNPEVNYWYSNYAEKKIAPKSVSEPVMPIINYLNRHGFAIN